VKETTLAALIDTVKNSTETGKRYCFIIGAGASRASGIKTGAELAEEWLAELEKIDPNATREWSEKENIDINDPGSQYAKIYERRFILDPADGFIRLQREMEDAIPSPGYYYLSEILDRTQNKLVITTNFDSLTEDSLFIYKNKKALVITHESLATYIDALSNRPTVIKIHRDLLLQPKSSEADVKILSEEWKKSLKKVMDIYIPIVIGYGGNDGSLMNFLEEVSSENRNLYWCYRRDRPVKDRIRNLLEKYRGFLIPIENFDDTMFHLGNAFGFDFSDETIQKITTDRAKKLVEKYDEWRTNRREFLAAKQTKSDTEIMTLDSIEDLSKRNIAELEEQIAEEPDNADRYVRLGREYHLGSEYRKAINCYDKAIELDPECPAYYYHRGVSYNLLYEYEKAIADFSKAMERFPYFAFQYYHRGISYSCLNEHEKAVTDMSKAIELEPRNSEYHLWLARILCYLDDFDNAYKNLNKATGMDKRTLPFCFNVRGFIGMKKAKHEKSKCKIEVFADLTKAIELIEDNASYSFFYTDLAEYYLYSNNPDDAYFYLEKVLSLHQSDGRIYFLMARYHETQGESDEYEFYMTAANECRFIPAPSDY